MASIAAHQATALWDVSMAEHRWRRVTTWEQHVHSFLESMPIMAASALGFVRWRAVRDLLDGARSREAWRLRCKKNRLPSATLPPSEPRSSPDRGSLRRGASPLRHQGRQDAAFDQREQQLVDGTLILTSPAGHTHVTTPGSALLFPRCARPPAIFPRKPRGH